MKSRFSFLLAASCLLAPALASAQGYIGVDLGSTRASDAAGKLSGTGVGGYLGYRFGNGFAAEVGYRQLFKDDFLGVEVTGSTLQISGLAYLPMSDKFSLFGRLGVGELKAKASVPGFAASDSESRALFGVGFEYAASPKAALRVEFQKPASDTSTFLIGGRFSF